jgi:hypothetical protein
MHNQQKRFCVFWGMWHDGVVSETTTPTTMTKAQINRAIKHTSLTIEGRRGDGYFYFLDTDGNHVGESIMVCYLKQLPLHRWVRLAEQAIA